MMPSIAPTEANEPLPKEIASRYRVEALLGRGGMAAVYRAHDEQLNRTVAIKCPLTDGSDKHNARLLDMIAREYRTLAQLKHPSVISVFEYGVGAEGPYYTMELLEGQDLHRLAPLPWREACAYLRDVASCLSLLHSRRLVHRDVSPRNIRCHEGRAKLLDFGALAPMGPIKQIVGTPPLIAPEVLHRQALDGSCDLYALGATLYWALTRRHAYPARTLPELPHVWQQRISPPSTFAPGVPEALDALVLSLLSHEPEARPRDAGEVMQRLSAIAGLPDDESLHVSEAYLTTPSLEGRDRELARVRETLAGVHDKSALIWITGEPGVGRSRFLGAALLEARLSGASVMHISASDGVPGDLALARDLLERSLEVLPHRENAGTRELLGAFDSARTLPEAARAKLLSRIRGLLRKASSARPVVLAIDDVDRADAASQVLIAGLRRSVRSNLLVLVTATEGRPLDPALEGQRASVEPIVLAPLSSAETEALLSGVFGEVPGLHVVATRVHELSRGNPRTTLELAEHLVASGKARYALGGWQLPAELPRDELPSAWSSTFETRLAALDADARELAEVIALSFEHGPTLVELDALTSHGDATRRQVALDALIAEGLVRLDAERASFARVADRERIAALTAAERSQALHARLARWLIARGADPIAIARCHLEAGEQGLAIDALLGAIAGGTLCDTAPSDYASVLERAIDATTAQGRPLVDRFQLTRELLKVGDHLGVKGIPARFAEVLGQLRLASGLHDYETLPADIDPLERLQKAYAAAQARFDATPEHRRVMAPLEAIQALALLTRQAAAFGAVSMDFEVLESLPDLTPFVALSEMLKTTVEHTLPASGHLTAGRYERALDGYRVTLDRLKQPDRGGLDEAFWRWAVNALTFALGHLHAGLGMDEALRYASELERDEAWVIAAWDVRRAYCLRQGDWREAERCRDRIERLRVQSVRRPPMVDTSARLELDTSAHAGDLMGVRRAMARMEGMIALHPGYAVYGHYGPALIAHLTGDHATALEHVDRALSMVQAGRHPTWPWIAGSRIEMLTALGRFEEAAEAGLAYVEQGTEAGLQVMLDHITVPLALAQAKLGDFTSAIEQLDRAIADRKRMGSTGLNLGWAYEVRARVAIWMRDQAAFARAAAACAHEYRYGRGGSTFGPKYEALRAEARAAGLQSASELPPAPDSEAITTYLSTLSGNTAIEDRLSLALSLLASAVGARHGVLYRMHAGALSRSSFTIERCASNVTGDIPSEATAWISSVLGTSLDEDDETQNLTADSPATRNEKATGHWLPMGLGCRRDGRYERTGAALLWFEPGASPKRASAELLEVVGRLLTT